MSDPALIHDDGLPALQGDVLPPEAANNPLPVERASVLRAAMACAGANAELMAYLVHGPAGQNFAFREEVAALLVTSLREVLTIEAHRLDVAVASQMLCSASEREVLGQLLGALERFREEWG